MRAGDWQGGKKKGRAEDEVKGKISGYSYCEAAVCVYAGVCKKRGVMKNISLRSDSVSLFDCLMFLPLVIYYPCQINLEKHASNISRLYSLTEMHHVI